MSDTEDKPGVEPETPHSGNLNRRDFITLAAILAASTALALSRMGADYVPRPVEERRPPWMRRFKRFVLAPKGTHVPRPDEVLAYGTQFPDARCVVLWPALEKFYFYQNATEVEAMHTRPGGTRLVWID